MIPEVPLSHCFTSCKDRDAKNPKKAADFVGRRFKKKAEARGLTVPQTFCVTATDTDNIEVRFTPPPQLWRTRRPTASR